MLVSLLIVSMHHSRHLVQCKLLNALHANVAVSSDVVIGHLFWIWLDLLVHMRSIRVEDALLAKFGARFQENLLDLHHIVFNVVGLNNGWFRLPRAKKLDESMYKSLKYVWTSYMYVAYVFPQMSPHTWNCVRLFFFSPNRDTSDIVFFLRVRHM